MERPTFPPMRYECLTLWCKLFGHRFRWQRIDWMWLQQWCSCGTTGQTRMDQELSGMERLGAVSRRAIEQLAKEKP